MSNDIIVKNVLYSLASNCRIAESIFEAIDSITISLFSQALQKHPNLTKLKVQCQNAESLWCIFRLLVNSDAL